MHPHIGQSHDQSPWINNFQNTSLPQESKAKEIEKPITDNPALTEMKKIGIFLTGGLPVSSRGIAINLIKGTALLFQGIGNGLAQAVRGEKVTSFSGLKEKLAENWDKGIKDSYVDLEQMPPLETLKIVQENMAYSLDHQYEKKLPENFPLGKFKNAALNIEAQLKELGFKRDEEGIYYHLNTGTMLNLSFDQDKNEILVCFWGIGNQNRLRAASDEQFDEIGNNQTNILLQNISEAVGDVVGLIQPSAIQAIKIGEILKNAANKEGLNPVATGHSHGGGLAQCAVLANGIKGVVFNSRALGPGIRRFIGQDKVFQNAKDLTNFSIKGDWVSGNKLLNFLAAAFERITGIPLAHTVGQTYQLPNDPTWDITGRHSNVKSAFILFGNNIHDKAVQAKEAAEKATKKAENRKLNTNQLNPEKIQNLQENLADLAKFGNMWGEEEE